MMEAYEQVLKEESSPTTADDAAREIADEIRGAEDGGFSDQDRDDFNSTLEHFIWEVSKNNDAVNHDDAQAVAAHEIKEILQDMHVNDQQFSDRASDTNWEMERALKYLDEVMAVRSGKGPGMPTSLNVVGASTPVMNQTYTGATDGSNSIGGSGL